MTFYAIGTINYMFSGIVQEVGTIKSLESKNGLLELTVSSERLMNDLSIGSSISINGCCQTVTEFSPVIASEAKQSHNRDNKNEIASSGKALLAMTKTFKVQATEETLRKTNFLNLQPGSKVNLEPALKFGGAVDGHLVSGHIDTIGEVSDIFLSGENKIIKISYSGEYGKYIASKGSISVNGVSLTIIDSKSGIFNFTLIPFTRDNTNLGLIKIGDLVNLETDLIGRYVVNYLENKTVNAIKL
jgi:riboflavin synthase